MNTGDKNLIINQINKYTCTKQPFLFMADFEQKNFILLKLDEIDNSILKYNFNGHRNYEPKSVEIFEKIKTIPPKFSEYKKSFDIVKQNINQGNSYLTNLTFETEIETNLSLEEIFFVSKAKYKIWLKDKFTFFSPEIFVQIKQNKIFSYPMKGTIDANIKDAQNTLLNDNKETAEHYTIVDLIRNDLSIIAKNVKVDKFRYIDKITSTNKNLLQMSSQISGILPHNYYENFGQIITSLLPAGSISGAPKKKTVEIINQAETHNRGFYTGIAGIFDGNDFDSCVIIRYIEQKNNKKYYKSGGGITTKSDVQKEYQELLDKIYIPV